MSTPNNVNPFDGLPPEMICYIFDYLDLDTLKSVSLTCRRLERIFSSYCCGRFMLYIADDKYVLPPRRRNRARAINGSMESVAKTLKHSTRYYQKVHLFFNCDELCMNSTVNKVLGTDWLPQLVVLKIAMTIASYDYLVQISAAVAKMDRLQELQFLETKLPSFDEFCELKIENNTLQRLVVQTSLPSVINCPKLRKLEVAYHLNAETNFGKQYAQYGGEEPYWKVKQLEEFTILNQVMYCISGSMEHRPGYKFKFYQQLTQLKKLHIYEAPISEKFLQSICESCVQLEDLFICALQAVDPNSLRYLSNLPHLRRLGIWFTMTPQPVSFASVSAPKLEHLTLGMVDVVWKSLESFQSIKFLNLAPLESFTSPDTMSFAKHVKQLEFVWLDLRGIRDPTAILAVLQELSLLKTLILEHLDVRWLNLTEMPPLPQLKRLVLYQCTEIQDFALNGKLFPNVKRIELEVPKCFSCDFKQRLRYDERLSRENWDDLPLH